MIKNYVKGNIVSILKRAVEEGNPLVIGHGCNCHDAMHSGVAWELQRAFPEVRRIDSVLHKSTMEIDGAPNNMLGTVSPVYIGGGTYVMNMYTQFYPGRDCRYDAIRAAFTSANKVLTSNGINSMLIPRIGAGIAGGDWDKITKIINETTPDLNITVVDWDGTVFDDTHSEMVEVSIPMEFR